MLWSSSQALKVIKTVELIIRHVASLKLNLHICLFCQAESNKFSANIGIYFGLPVGGSMNC